MGYFVTKISVKKSRKTAAAAERRPEGQTFALGGVVEGADHLYPAALDSAGRRLAHFAEPEIPGAASNRGALKNSLIDVCDEIEGGSTLSEAMAKSPKAFNRLYVNMIKAGEAGGALEVISNVWPSSRNGPSPSNARSRAPWSTRSWS